MLQMHDRLPKLAPSQHQEEHTCSHDTQSISMDSDAGSYVLWHALSRHAVNYCPRLDVTTQPPQKILRQCVSVIGLGISPSPAIFNSFLDRGELGRLDG